MQYALTRVASQGRKCLEDLNSAGDEARSLAAPSLVHRRQTVNNLRKTFCKVHCFLQLCQSFRIQTDRQIPIYGVPLIETHLKSSKSVGATIMQNACQMAIDAKVVQAIKAKVVQAIKAQDDGAVAALTMYQANVEGQGGSSELLAKIHALKVNDGQKVKPAPTGMLVMKSKLPEGAMAAFKEEWAAIQPPAGSGTPMLQMSPMVAALHNAGAISASEINAMHAKLVAGPAAVDSVPVQPVKKSLMHQLETEMLFPQTPFFLEDKGVNEGAITAEEKAFKASWQAPPPQTIGDKLHAMADKFALTVNGKGYEYSSSNGTNDDVIMATAMAVEAMNTAKKPLSYNELKAEAQASPALDAYIHKIVALAPSTQSGYKIVPKGTASASPSPLAVQAISDFLKSPDPFASVIAQETAKGVKAMNAFVDKALFGSVATSAVAAPKHANAKCISDALSDVPSHPHLAQPLGSPCYYCGKPSVVGCDGPPPEGVGITRPTCARQMCRTCSFPSEKHGDLCRCCRPESAIDVGHPLGKFLIPFTADGNAQKICDALDWQARRYRNALTHKWHSYRWLVRRIDVPSHLLPVMPPGGIMEGQPFPKLNTSQAMLAALMGKDQWTTT